MKTKRGYYDVFVGACARYPSNTAVRLHENDCYHHYTYSELYGVCEYISQNIQQLGCTKGIIGLLSERNIIVPCVIAATHKCSTTFMFLDPSQNIENIVKDIKFSVVITIKKDEINATSEFLNKKPDKSMTIFNLAVNFYSMMSSYCGYGNNNYISEHSYIAMTSGSTGYPKHIQVPIRCLEPNIDDLTKMFDISQRDIIYFSTPLTFDPSMIEILLACMNGASLLIAPENAEILFPENGENSVTFWQTTPSKFFQQTNDNIKNKILNANSTLRILALGGEPLNGVKRLKQLKDCNNKTRIFTLYGVTEMSCWACATELDLNRILTDREIPLGECLSETQLVVRPVDNSNTGKIILVSKTRKCIILNSTNGREEENSLKFIDTGDFGENKNGNIYYRGRKDDVIKRFGHKVNLQLIESTIMQCPRVKTCSCIWLPKPMLLVVYYSSETLSSQELSDFLKCKLDDKHWPDKIIRADTLPTNPHGKLSKRILCKMYEKILSNTKSSDTLKDNFLTELKALLHRDFNYEDIKDKDFYSIGGTSFLAIALCNKLSLTLPQFAKFLLSHIVSQKNSIKEILQLAQKELGLDEKRPRKRIRRSMSNSESIISTVKSFKKNSVSPTTPVNFAVVWGHNTGKCVDASPTIFRTGLNVYVTVGSHSGKVLVVDAITGILQGVVKLKSRIEASVLCYEDEKTPPCGMVGTYDGTVVRFSLDSCKEIWKTNVGAMIKSKGVCSKGLFYVAAYDGNVCCIDIVAGEIRQKVNVADQAISADLVLAKGQFVLLGTLSGTCACLHTETKSIIWRSTVGSPVFANPVVYDNEKYVVFAEVNGEIHCRTVEKGIKIWKYQGAKGNIFSSMYIREIEKLKWHIVFGCHDSKVYCVNLKNFQPTLHWRTELTSPVYATPCCLNNKYLLGVANNGTINIIESENGNIVGEYTLPNEAFSSPAVYGDYIFIGCRDDHLYSIKYAINL